MGESTEAWYFAKKQGTCDPNLNATPCYLYGWAFSGEV